LKIKILRTANNVLDGRVSLQGNQSFVAHHKADRPQTMQKTRRKLVCRDALEKFGFAWQASGCTCCPASSFTILVFIKGESIVTEASACSLP